MTQLFFITGTDTDAGKTSFAVAWLKHLNSQGFLTQGIKPIASGGLSTPKGVHNDDALAIQSAMSLTLPYSQINPIALTDPIAPHIAAEREGRSLKAADIIEMVESRVDPRADVCLIEGAGGWFTPLNSHETYADVVTQANWPVIVVVGMKLGCLNHALLTMANLTQRGIQTVGWIANIMVEPMTALSENLAYLDSALPVPRLATLHSQHRLSVGKLAESVTSPAL